MPDPLTAAELRALEDKSAGEPQLIECTKGRWMAMSPAAFPVAFAVIGQTKDAAVTKYRESLAIWMRALCDNGGSLHRRISALSLIEKHGGAARIEAVMSEAADISFRAEQGALSGGVVIDFTRLAAALAMPKEGA